MKKLISSLLSLALAIPLTVPAFAAGQAFRDVPADHWAAPYIERAFEDGAISGTYYDAKTGARDYSPESTLTMAQFIVILTQAFYPEAVLAQATNNPTVTGWYAHHKQVALNYELFVGTSGLDYMDAPISRYDMAAVMCNLLKDHDQEVEPAERQAVQARIGDWSAIPEKYQYAVSTVFSLGVISGTDSKGTFSGQNYMTRAQSAVVYCRLRDAIDGTFTPVVKPGEKPVGTPATPEEPAAPANVFDFDFSDYTYVQDFADAINAATPAYREGYLTNGKPITDENIQDFLGEIKRILPDGREWNGLYRYHYRSPKFGGGGGCNSFAYLVSDWMFGEDAPLIEHQNFLDIKPGDVFWYENASGTKNHLVVVSYVEIDPSDDWYYFEGCDGNVNGRVGWRGIGHLDDFLSNRDSFADLSYIYSRY